MMVGYTKENSSLVVIGLSVHTTPVELREKLAIPEVEWPRAIGELCGLNHIEEAAVLSTCNRMEIYVVALSQHRGIKEVTEWMSSCIFWNIRGIANASSRLALKRLISVNNLDLVLVAEPWMDFSKFLQTWLKKLNLKLFAMNYTHDLLPNLWCFCKSNITPTVLLRDSQHVSFTIVDNNKVFGYPWCFIGDFNSIIEAEEYHGSNTPDSTPMKDFHSWSDTDHLIHLPTMGNPFTWSNGRLGRKHSEKRLDRAVCNFHWIDTCSSTSCHTLVKNKSDHYPLLLNFEYNDPKVTSNFKFMNMWTLHKDCLNLVSQTWHSKVYGCHVYVLDKNLRILKANLKEWNKNSFGNVQEKVKIAEDNLIKIQDTLASQGYSEVLQHQEKEPQEALNEALDIEEAFWKEKARVNWCTNGDRKFGCDEKTIKAVCVQNSVQRDQLGGSDIYETVRSEVRRAISEIQIDLESAIQVSNATAVTVTDMADIHPDLLSPGTIELALETRREYTKKLEEAKERARRLRADLAVEEHRVRELDRILREVLPYPKTPNIPKSRPSRKSSIERKRMSKRLAEDAKAYFDECVSLSTFDSSDFSSQEDPPLSMVGPPTPSRLTEQSGTREQSHHIHYDTMQPPASIDSEEAIHEQVSSTADSKETDSKYCFSFAQKPSEGTTAQQDIQQYIKKFEKSVSKLPSMRSSYGDMCDYSFQSSAESLLIDRVMLRSRIESGRFLLCGGGNFWSP
ncbi:unnamed protein product [Vicia faba]|uniref:Glutamyl-tRNA reductase N-terminal domain-containing protein n=1 Tax=Vicia faba TaxID=3906 RepID=A0AAV0Z3R1_VICFA|nr:unnamed protein product [Vicia faba]